MRRLLHGFVPDAQRLPALLQQYYYLAGAIRACVPQDGVADLQQQADVVRVLLRLAAATGDPLDLASYFVSYLALLELLQEEKKNWPAMRQAVQRMGVAAAEARVDRAHVDQLAQYCEGFAQLENSDRWLEQLERDSDALAVELERYDDMDAAAQLQLVRRVHRLERSLS